MVIDASSGTAIVPLDLRDRARVVVRRLGLRAAAAALGIAHTTLAAALAGLPVRRGSLAILAAALPCEAP